MRNQKKMYLVTEITPEHKEDNTADPFPTKKATTIMPKEVFMVLQRYCVNHDTPKHRALYLFILDGLHAAGEINDADYQRFKDMAEQITTTYEKNETNKIIFNPHARLPGHDGYQLHRVQRR